MAFLVKPIDIIVRVRVKMDLPGQGLPGQGLVSLTSCRPARSPSTPTTWTQWRRRRTRWWGQRWGRRYNKVATSFWRYVIGMCVQCLLLCFNRKIWRNFSKLCTVMLHYSTWYVASFIPQIFISKVSQKVEIVGLVSTILEITKF